jgi:hypothetical protein
MSDFSQEGNRWTAIYVKDGDCWKRAPYDLVRFNVDVDPDAKPVIVPNVGGDQGKRYERIWRVQEMPYSEKVDFGG